ncbi:MAG: TetR/AcrR family transcriptional regulator [Dermatophilaceae bacterium]
MSDSPRPYHSAVRAGVRRLTLRRCVEAAAELFLTQGYAATTIDAIADRAGIARRTVFTASGGKVALLKLAYDWALVGDDEPVPMSQRPEILAIAAERRPRRAVRLWSEHVTTVASRSTAMLLVMQAAADTDAEAKALYDKAMSDARFGAGMFVNHCASIATLRRGLDPERATDLVWGLLDPGVFDRMVRHGRWSAAEFAEWLTEMVASSLLPASRRSQP